MVRDRMAELGLDLLETETRRKDKATGAQWSTWSWSCEAEKLPNQTARARNYEPAARSVGAYGIYSAAAHAECMR